MKLMPSDLGVRRNVAILRLRAMTSGTGATGNAGAAGSFLSTPLPTAGTTAPLGPFGRMWTAGLGLDDAARSAVFDAIKPMAMGIGWGLGAGAGGGMLGPTAAMFATGNSSLAVLFGMVSGAMMATGFAMPGVFVRKWQKTPVSPAEIDTLLHSISGDPLERDFLELAREVSTHEVPDTAAKEIRESLAALADAIDSLPPLSHTHSEDAESLLARAEEVRLQGIAESDAVVSASYLRRAEALASAAQASHQSSLLLRRSRALRAELSAQTEALRLGLLSFQNGSTDTSHLASLAAQVRTVATETSNVAAARTELDRAVAAPNIPVSAESAPETIRLGKAG